MIITSMDISESQVFFVVWQFWTNITILESKSWVKTSNTKVWQLGNLLIEEYSCLQKLLHIWYLRMFTITNWLLLKKQHKVMRFIFCIYLVGLSWPIQSCLNVPLDSRPLIKTHTNEVQFSCLPLFSLPLIWTAILLKTWKYWNAQLKCISCKIIG